MATGTLADDSGAYAHAYARYRNFEAKIKELRDKRPRVPDIVDILLFRMMITAAMVCKWLMDFCRLRACQYYLSYYCTQKLRLFAALFTSPSSLPLTAPFIRWLVNIRGPKCSRNDRTQMKNNHRCSQACR